MAHVIVETWRPIREFEGLYEISNLGEVASLPRKGRMRRQILTSVPHVRGGYLYVNLCRDGRQFHRKIHHLVCEAFNGSRPDGTVARHLDGDHLNNDPANLAWGTPSENNFDRVRHGRHHNAEKFKCKSGHRFDSENTYINPASGQRQCRTCMRDYRARYVQRKASKCQS